VIVNKSGSIIAPAGIYAGISVFANSLGVGVGVSIDVAGGRVELEGLTITGLGGWDGIDFFSGTELRVSRLQIQGFISTGIGMIENNGYALIVTDSVLSRNGYAGIVLAGSGSTLSSAIVDRCRFEDNHLGLTAGDGKVAHVRDSTFYRNFRGIELVTYLTDSKVDVDNSVIAQNEVGLFGQTLGVGQAQIRVARSTIVGNTFLALEAQPASSIVSRGDNTLADNAGGEAFTGTFLPK